ncbi:MAG: hypothetical protein M1815_003625, partial [Lichina confinis]
MAFTNFIDRDTAISLVLKPLDDEAPIIITPDRHHICTFSVFKPSFQMQDELGQQVKGQLWLHEHDPNLHIWQGTWQIRDMPSGANKLIHLL